MKKQFPPYLALLLGTAAIIGIIGAPKTPSIPLENAQLLYQESSSDESEGFKTFVPLGRTSTGPLFLVEKLCPAEKKCLGTLLHFGTPSLPPQQIVVALPEQSEPLRKPTFELINENLVMWDMLATEKILLSVDINTGAISPTVSHVSKIPLHPKDSSTGLFVVIDQNNAGIFDGSTTKPIPFSLANEEKIVFASVAGDESVTLLTSLAEGGARLHSISSSGVVKSGELTPDINLQELVGVKAVTSKNTIFLEVSEIAKSKVLRLDPNALTVSDFKSSSAPVEQSVLSGSSDQVVVFEKTSGKVTAFAISDGITVQHLGDMPFVEPFAISNFATVNSRDAGILITSDAEPAVVIAGTGKLAIQKYSAEIPVAAVGGRILAQSISDGLNSVPSIVLKSRFPGGKTAIQKLSYINSEPESLNDSAVLVAAYTDSGQLNILSVNAPVEHRQERAG